MPVPVAAGFSMTGIEVSSSLSEPLACDAANIRNNFTISTKQWKTMAYTIFKWTKLNVLMHGLVISFLQAIARCHNIYQI